MEVNINKQLISMTEANQNFSKVARIVDENGTAVVLKNNQPKYVIMDYSVFSKYEMQEDDSIDEVADRVLKRYSDVFKELAK